MAPSHYSVYKNFCVSPNKLVSDWTQACELLCYSSQNPIAWNKFSETKLVYTNDVGTELVQKMF